MDEDEVDDQIDSSDAIIEENKENIPVETFPNIWRPPPTTMTTHLNASDYNDEIVDENLTSIDCKNLQQYQDLGPASLPPSSKKTKFPSKSKSESFRNNKTSNYWPRKHAKKSFWLKNQGRRRGNDKNRPGLRQVLSPKALYPSGPPHVNVQDQKAGNGNNKIIQAASGGSSSSSMAPVSNSSSGAGSNSSSSRMNAKRTGGSLNNNGELDLENLEYPDSPTSHKWFAGKLGLELKDFLKELFL